jgi:hypothetical protein
MSEKIFGGVGALFGGLWLIVLIVSLFFSCAISVGLLWLLYETIQYLQRLG